MDSSDKLFRAAFQGEPGAYSEAACHEMFQNYKGLYVVEHRPSFEAVFEAVEHGDVDLAVLPIENSLGGSIHANYDLLLRYSLQIIGELRFFFFNHRPLEENENGL